MPEPPYSRAHERASTDLLTVDEAREIVLAAFRPLPVVELPLLDALGLVLAEDVWAAVDVPPFRNSAMDGFAVRAADTLGATELSPVRLRVTGQISAGQPPFGHVAPGGAIRIMTGAPIPLGADAVVRFEATLDAGRDKASRSGLLDVFAPVQPGEHIRGAGEDVAAGQWLLPAGSVVSPAVIGVLASIDLARVRAHHRPRVAVLSTGNEVVDLGRQLRPGEIRDSNGYLLTALVAQAGGVPIRLGIADDSAAAIQRQLELAADADLILTSGGVSVGDYDMVKDVLRQAGDVAVWQVAMRPGKPLAFGRVGGVPLIGLPGNPLAAAVGFELFAKPALRKMLGHRQLGPWLIMATLSERIEHKGERQLFVPANLTLASANGATVRPIGKRGAGMLTSLLAANSLITLSAQQTVAEPGTLVMVQMLHHDLDLAG